MTTPIPVKLDRERFVLWSNSAKYRMSLVTLHPQNTYAAIVQWIWACLVPEDAKAFPTPEHIAEFMPVERADEFVEIVGKLNASIPKPKKPGAKESEEEAKNAVGSPS